MSRETDTSSSGPQGREQTAYPSGTQPYGPAQGETSEENTGAEAAGSPPEDRKTETTLTTRIRINIPGSRPIPPVVMRTPVSEDGAAGAASSGDAAGPAAPGAPAARPDSPSERGDRQGARPNSPLPVREKKAPKQATAAERKPDSQERTSDWFAPRKSARAGSPADQGGTPPAGGGTPSVPGARSAPGGPTAPNSAGFPAGSGIPGTEPGGPVPGATANGSAPFGSGAPSGSSEPDTGGFPLSGAGGGFPGGGQENESYPGAHSGDTGGFPAVAPGDPLNPDTGGYVLPGGGLPGGAPDAFTGPSGADPFAGPAASDPFGGPTGSAPFGADAQAGGPEGEPRRGDLPYFSPDAGPGAPAGPTGGPVTGDGPLGAGDPAAQLPGVPGPLGGPGPMSDETAVLTPQKPAPTPVPERPDGNVSGHTLTSGIPVVPPETKSPFTPAGRTDGPPPQTVPKLPEPVERETAVASAPKKKGRNKLVLVAVAVVGIAGVAYGAGLLLNHSDVPSGTTVLGVDISGTRDDAVQKLNAELGDRSTKSLKLSVDGDTVELRPEQAGLTLDTDATVGEASGSDYNPVSVIGSLFGGERVVEPVMPVDEEKLRAALERAAGGSGSATEGTIKFEPGKAVAVYGKAGKGIDVNAATQAVEKAYRTQVEQGSAGTVKLPTTTREPSVPNAEVDRMMKSFAKPAMSGLVTVQTDPGHTVSFSPERSIHQFLSVKVVDGKLVEYYDRKVLKELYGGAFDGVTITKGNGSKKPVSPEDVASALSKALRGATPAERIVTIETNPR
ncbi:hypothetical protein HUT18_23855 [Streptomyces sp. NA04227]|uniref:hypothetical protein n=1 Tax=Streptomyces sp. NA04227 TaxID=2742136 RepID=UPI001590D25B|nr:hypothetical protein [Streptomyces sp. NA04227]QKW08966.1 hypothetical protein HUT18_23855 [Streptomyces sp. NA04227]